MCCDVLCHYLCVLQRYKLLEGKKSSPFLQEVDPCSPTVLTTLGGREKKQTIRTCSEGKSHRPLLSACTKTDVDVTAEMGGLQRVSQCCEFNIT